MAEDGRFVLTEAEVAFDAADATRFGKDNLCLPQFGKSLYKLFYLYRHTASLDRSFAYKCIYTCS